MVTLSGLFFDEGRLVKKGQLLYEIDKTRYLATYEQAAADVQIAETNMERAQKDADRYKFLLERKPLQSNVPIMHLLIIRTQNSR